MNTSKFAQRTLARLGVLTPETRAERLAQFLHDTPAHDPRRQRIEQLLQLARERRNQEIARR